MRVARWIWRGTLVAATIGFTVLWFRSTRPGTNDVLWFRDRPDERLYVYSKTGWLRFAHFRHPGVALWGRGSLAGPGPIGGHANVIPPIQGQPIIPHLLYYVHTPMDRPGTNYLGIAVPHWPFVALFGAASLYALAAHPFRRWRRRRRGLCLRCGYNLTGNVSGRCPECGTPTDPSAHTSGAG
jgi:hypothetical protein